MRRTPIKGTFKNRAADRDWQRAEYNENMRVKRGELIWDPDAYPDRYGSRGAYVTPATFATRRNPDASLADLRVAHSETNEAYWRARIIERRKIEQIAA